MKKVFLVLSLFSFICAYSYKVETHVYKVGTTPNPDNPDTEIICCFYMLHVIFDDNA